jgi:hypothetical protein
MSVVPDPRVVEAVLRVANPPPCPPAVLPSARPAKVTDDLSCAKTAPPKFSALNCRARRTQGQKVSEMEEIPNYVLICCGLHENEVKATCSSAV